MTPQSTSLRAGAALALAASLALAGCNTLSAVGSLNPFHGKAKASTAARGTRIPVVASEDQLKVSDSLKGQDFALPSPTPLADWPLPGGTPAQSVEHVDAAPNFVVAWRRPIGRKTTRRAHITAPPIAAGGRIFVMDAEAEVSAHDARTGATIWRTNIMPHSRRGKLAFGGGVAFANGTVYASSGYREVVALDAATGALRWRSSVDAPLHAAPTVFGDRVYVEDVNDELFAFDTATGNQVWTYQALTEPARILAATSPAVDGDTLIASFASGELVALRAANGNELWNTPLSKTSRTNALSEIRDIPGRPVIYRGDVYAVSHAEVFAAVDLRTGIPRWTLPITAVTTPWPAGDVVYVVSQSGQVICVARESGQVYWIRDLNEPGALAGKKGGKSKKRTRIYWSSPVLADNRLILVSTQGTALALNPKTGATLGALRLGSDAVIGPIAVGGMVYVVTEGGDLVAIR